MQKSRDSIEVALRVIPYIATNAGANTLLLIVDTLLLFYLVLRH